MQRRQAIKLKTAKGRKLSSTLWLQRQLNDPYTIRAKKEGYFSRAAYKLLEIDSKLHIFSKNKIIIDLGSAPGSWSQVALKTNPKKIISVDLIHMNEVDGAKFILGDFTNQDVIAKIFSSLENAKANVILSDMAPNTSGHKDLDHLKIIDLCEHTFEFAKKVLAKDGILIMKVFQGGKEKLLADKLRKSFSKIKFFKPQASRKKSPEIFLIAIGFIS